MESGNNFPEEFPGEVFHMNTKKETFHKSERLCSTKVISGLFENGTIFYTSLFKIVWSTSQVQLPYPAQVMFSVSKKGFRLAVTRNRIKRRIREAYRKNKEILYGPLSSERNQIVFAVILRGSSVPDYTSIEKSVKEVLNKLITMVDREKSKIC